MRYLGFSFLPFLLFLVVFQSPQDAIRKHYEAAESYRTAGNLPGAEAEFAAILAEGYLKLGKIHSTQGQYKEAIEMFDAALSYRPRASWHARTAQAPADKREAPASLHLVGVCI